MNFDFSKADSIGRDNLLLLLLLAAGMLLTGVGEEFLCRGFLYNIILNRYKSVKKAVFISSAIFGIVHLIALIYQPVIETLMLVVDAFAAGVLLAAIYVRCKNIWSCVFIHAFYNIAVSAASILTPPDNVVTESAGGIIEELAAYIPVFIVSILSVCLGLFLIRKKKTADIVCIA
jgi:membrane protease YdiL (CAAX protease family)